MATAPFLSPVPPLPPAIASQFGSGAGLFGAQGNLAVQIASGGITPGATGADNVLAVYSLPGFSFDNAGRGLWIEAAGSFAATANTKRLKIVVNPASAVVGSTVGGSGVTIADSGAVTTNGGGWFLSAGIYKYGTGGANTQLGVHQQALVGAASAALLAPSAIAATESGAILIAITGNATTAATDIVFNMLQITGMN